MVERSHEERKAYRAEQDLLPFKEKDCFFCGGKKCDACSQTGKLCAIMTKEAWEGSYSKWMEKQTVLE